MKAWKKGIGFLLALAAVLTLFAIGAMAESVDPTGASYVATTGIETLDSVAITANKAYFGANYTWVMICAFLVFFFQCAFAVMFRLNILLRLRSTGINRLKI
jgi:Amt family ammonium transporter